MKKIFWLFSLLAVITLACNFSVNIAPTSEVPAAATTPIVVVEPATTTPEIFISLTQAIPAHVQFNGITLAVQEASLNVCDIPNCPSAPAGTRYLRVSLQALNLPTDQSLDYKNLPTGIVIHDNTGANTPFNRLSAYTPDTQRLFLYFAVPEAASVFGLQWPDTAEIPLTVVVSTVPPTMPPSDVVVTVDPLTILLSPSIASGVRGSQIPRNEGQDQPYYELTPGHTEIKLEGYRLQGKLREPTIYVFPATDYGLMVPSAFESIHRLNNILYGPNGPTIPASNDQLPGVPFFNAAQVFAANAQILSFQNGSGIRFVTEYAQSAAPVNNHELFYQFTGISRNGTYYIVAVFPITAPGLAETGEPGAAIPVGGVAYPDINDPNADWQGYYNAVTAFLNNTSPDAFTPTLSQLDALIQSIQVVP